MKLTRSNKGAALVEFALVTVLLITLIFGIIEFGLLMKDYLTLCHAAREGARSAALGSPTSSVESRVVDYCTALNGTPSISLYKRAPDSSGGWEALGDTVDNENDADPGGEVRVSLAYDHELVTGSLFSWLADNGSTVTIHGEMSMNRE